MKRLTKAGLLLIEVDRRQYAENLLNTEYFHDIPVSISEHRTLNSSKGVIYTHVLDDMTNEEIKTQLKDKGVKEVYRIMTTKNGVKSGSPNIIITFETPKLPEYLYIGYLRVSVRAYVPSPFRCFKCQKFGHTVKYCTHEAVCEKCGQSGHEVDDCSNPVQCVNCGGNHSASSRVCSQWKLKKAILEYKYKYDVPYPEAEKHVTGQINISKSTPKTYSSVAADKNSVVSKTTVGVQTILTWPQYDDQPRPVLTINKPQDNVETNTSNKSVQSEEIIESMDVENATKKRGRGESSSSTEDDDSPDIKKLNSKRDSDRQEDKNVPAPTPLADQQVSKEVRETPPKHQEDSSSGKATVGGKGKDLSKPQPPSAAEGKDNSKGGSKPSAVPSSTSPEGGKGGSSGSARDQKSVVANKNKNKNKTRSISPIKTSKSWK